MAYAAFDCFFPIQAGEGEVQFSRTATETRGRVGGLAPREPLKPSVVSEKSKMPPPSPTIR